MKVVFDTNVLISSSLWYNSVAYKLLIKLIKEDTEIFTSIEILDEYVKVLKRDFRYDNNKIQEIVIKLLDFLKIIKPLERFDIINDDPSDNRILECAYASDSTFILTYDKHLLKIKEFKNIKIITPEEFLKII
ncbi:MAG: putative toxin-antitoxin system toxin component, PIN family [Nanoarchaeota archaeon]|nr:putative toxin-antitoxin system toxin component, PIN family [Nanoarchaeota archaeon]